MSKVNLGNPKVLQNFIKNQIKEGKGKYEVRKEVKIFIDDSGSEFVVPVELEVAAEKAEQKQLEAVDYNKLNAKEVKEIAENKGIEIKGLNKSEVIIELENAQSEEEETPEEEV